MCALTAESKRVKGVDTDLHLVYAGLAPRKAAEKRDGFYRITIDFEDQLPHCVLPRVLLLCPCSPSLHTPESLLYGDRRCAELS